MTSDLFLDMTRRARLQWLESQLQVRSRRQQTYCHSLICHILQVMNDRERARKRHEEQIVKFCAGIVTAAAADAVVRSVARVKIPSSSSFAAAPAAGESAAKERLQWIDKYLQGNAEPVTLPVIPPASSATTAADDDETAKTPPPIRKAPQPPAPPSIPALDSVRSKHQQTHLPTHFAADLKPSASASSSAAATTATEVEVKPIQSSLSRRRAEAARASTPPLTPQPILFVFCIYAVAFIIIIDIMYSSAVWIHRS